ncbi:MAG: hypothetical protein JSW31_06460 [Burkholderiales bacterium]|nr:MAG: hypothetical protein JSW31_06460 [Burkholderiales bacterium]
MFKFNTGVITVAALTALSFAGTSALAADPPSQNARDLKDNTCKDVMRLSGQDRDVALALAHGYVLGKKGTTKFEIDRLALITDKFIDHCLDNPKDNALAAFEKIAN